MGGGVAKRAPARDEVIHCRARRHGAVGDDDHPERLVGGEEVHVGVLLRPEDRAREDAVVAEAEEVLDDDGGVGVEEVLRELVQLRGGRREGFPGRWVRKEKG